MLSLFACSLIQETIVYRGWTGQAELVRLLIEAGVDTEKRRSIDGLTPLQMAVYQGPFEVVRFLIEAAVEFDKAKADTGATPLYVAAEKGQAELVRFLIEARADVEATH